MVFQSPARIRQGRFTVLIRAILAIPAEIALAVLISLTVPLTAVAWLWIVTVGSTPAIVRRWNVAAVKFFVSYSDYWLLLTENYPSFQRTPDSDSRDLRYRPPRTLLALSLRGLLMFPVAALAYTGAQILAIAGWVYALLTGMLPEPLFVAFAGINRYMASAIGCLTLIETHPATIFNGYSEEFHAQTSYQRVTLSCVVLGAGYYLLINAHYL